MPRDYNLDWRSMNESQQRQILKAWAKTANRRIRRLRENGADPYNSNPIGHYLKSQGRRTIPGASPRLQYHEVLRALEETQLFLLNENSTISGLRRTADEVYQRLKKSLDFEEDIDSIQFYNFMHSSEFKRGREYFDSKELVKDFVETYSKIPRDEFSKMFQEYLTNTEIGYDEMKQIMQNAVKGKINAGKRRGG